MLAYAEKTLPLDKVATGPAEEMGLGKKYQIHFCLDFVIQELGKYPGQGWPLIAAALQSPVIRNRNMALKVLSAWGKSQWPPEVTGVLKAAEAIEPHLEVKERLRKLIAGIPMDESRGISKEQ